MNLIEASNLSYTYPDGTRALADVSVSVRAGEFTAVVGPNGGGKSTLLLNVKGVLSPSEGGVSVKGESGLVFQNPDDMLFTPTVFEDVAFGPQNMGLRKDEVERRVKESLEYVELPGFSRRAPHHLSFGEKKRVSLACVLSMNPQILLLDEPTLGMDPWVRRDFFELFGKLRREHTILAATHDLDFARTADTVYYMGEGRLKKIDDITRILPRV